MYITCNGEKFNKCLGLTEQRAISVLDMYGGTRPKNQYNFKLYTDDGRVIKEVQSAIKASSTGRTAK